VACRDESGNLSPLSREVSIRIPANGNGNGNGNGGSLGLVVDLTPTAERLDLVQGRLTIRWSTRSDDEGVEIAGFLIHRETLYEEDATGPDTAQALPSSRAGAPEIARFAGIPNEGPPDGCELLTLTEEMITGYGLHAFEESPLPLPGSYRYWIEAVGQDGDADWLEPVLVRIPDWQTDILSVFPNPSPGSFEIVYSLDAAQEISLSVFDVGGRLINSYDAVHQTDGRHSWRVDDPRRDGRETLPAGTYFLRLQMGDRVRTARVVLKARQ